MSKRTKNKPAKRAKEVLARRKKAGQKYKGVRAYGRKRFRATIQARKGKKTIFLHSSYHDTALGAARAYDAAARKVLGKSARLNFPRRGELAA